MVSARPRSVTFVSRNAGKVPETRETLRPYGVTLRWRRKEFIEPQAARLEEVVRAKLHEVEGWAGYVLVEDSGFFIPSLNGFPGVYSAHVLEAWGFTPILELLRSRPREAYFRTVAGLRRGRSEWLFVGEVRGTVARRPAGHGGFGYDPIFLPRGWKRTFAEATPEEKNGISHRARAMRKVGKFLVGRPT
ncbi:MAG: non-canonical purine NTP pyrophosphatase [Thermoplasmata archaeon]|nr:non-canonical purine NTP pyrophosphatase [Thermoplasmata archaeon]